MFVTTVVCLGILLFILLLPQILGETTAVTSYLASILYRNNFHEVLSGRVYRSAEMPTVVLKDYLDKYRIKSVLDLRRSSSSADALSEKSIVESSGAKYFQLKIHGTSVPSREKAKMLFEIFDQVQLPLLIHCSSGTHRSGVVAAIWLMDKEGLTFELACTQLSPRYGFFYVERRFKSFVLGTPTIDSLLWKYKKETSCQVPIRDWATNHLSFIKKTAPSATKVECKENDVLIYG